MPTKSKKKKKAKKKRKVLSYRDVTSHGNKPYKFDKICQVLIDSLASGSTVTSACYAADISRGAYYYFVNKYPKFKVAIDEALKNRTAIVVDALFYNAVIRKDVQAEKFWLTNRDSRNWKNLNHEKIDVKQPIQIVYEDAPKRKKS